MPAFSNVSSLGLQRIWDGVHGRIVHGERITLGVLELDANSVVPEPSNEHEELGGITGRGTRSEQRALEPEQRLLAVQAAAVADELAVRADHPVAREHDRQRVSV